MRRALHLLIALVLTLPGASQAQGRGPRTATFLHFNDVYEIGAIDGGKIGGLARVATFAKQLRRTLPGVVTTLGGDFLSPSALGLAEIGGERLAGRQMVSVLNAVGVSWATLGNHEFDVREAEFRARMAEARFPVVVSNVVDSSGKRFPNTVASAVRRLRTAGGTLGV